MRAYISSASVDRAICNRVFRVLDGFKVDTWLDRSAGGSNDRLKVVENEIATRDLFLFVATCQAIERGGVAQDELTLIQKRIIADPTCRFIPLIVDSPILPEWMQRHQSVFVNDDLERAIFETVFVRQPSRELTSSKVLFNPSYKSVERTHERSMVEYDLPAFFLAGDPELSNDVTRILEGVIIKSAVGSACINQQENTDTEWVRRSIFRTKKMFASENVISLLISVSHDINRGYGLNFYWTINFDLRTGQLYTLDDALNLMEYGRDLAMALEMDVPPAGEDTFLGPQDLRKTLASTQFFVDERGLRVLSDNHDRFIDFTNSDLASVFKLEWSGFARHISCVP